MTSPYGSDPNQPQGLGVPGARGPQFVPPSQPGTYGPPSQPNTYGPQAQPNTYGGPPPGSYGPPSQPNPYGQPSQPNPYGGPPPGSYGTGSGYGQGPTLPPYPQSSPPPRRRSTAWLIILVAVALVAGAVAVYAMLKPALPPSVTQPTPTRPVVTPKATKGATTSSTSPTTTPDVVEDCDGGQTVGTTLFSVTVPADWSCDGGDGDISISSPDDDAMWAFHDDGVETEADCRGQLDGMGTLQLLPDEAWGNVTAHSYRAVDGSDVYGVRCAVVGKRTWYLVYYPNLSGDEESVKKTVSAFLRSWVWK